GRIEARARCGTFGDEVDGGEEREEREQPGRAPRPPSLASMLASPVVALARGRARAPRDSEHESEDGPDRRELEPEVEERVPEPRERSAEGAGGEAAPLALEPSQPARD